MANGQEFKHYLKGVETKPDIVCIQETWLKPNFVVNGYIIHRRDRSLGGGGGCMTLIKQGIPNRVMRIGDEHEYIITEVWDGTETLIVINYYNPCKRLNIDTLQQIQGQNKSRVVWCADFNAHSTIWGGAQTDVNGKVVEEFMDNNDLVCMNNGNGTRINVTTGTESALDITLVASSLAGITKWEVWTKTTLGSDHYPVHCCIGEKVEKRVESGAKKWLFEKANWEEFQRLSEEVITTVDLEDEVDLINKRITAAIITTAEKSIPRSKGTSKKRLVPWWTEECNLAVKTRNRAFRVLKRTHTMVNLIHYIKAQAEVRKTVRRAKRESWRNFCDTIVRTTSVGQVWGMVKRMGGDRRDWEYPVMEEEGGKAVTDKEKAEVMAKAFAKVHSSDNLTEEGNRRRERMLSQYSKLINWKQSNNDGLDDPFTLAEMIRAIKKSRPTSPGKDQVGYAMLKYLGERALNKMLGLYNKVWEEGKLPEAWKEAVVIPIRKPGKDPSKPTNYRPIALTSNLCNDN